MKRLTELHNSDDSGCVCYLASPSDLIWKSQLSRTPWRAIVGKGRRRFKAFRGNLLDRCGMLIGAKVFLWHDSLREAKRINKTN